MDLEEERDVVGLGLTNGQGSVDSQAHSLDPSTDSSATKEHFAANGYHSSASARQAALTEQTGEEKQHAKTNGRASTMAGKGEGGHAEEDLWGSILNSVKSSRAVPVKNIIMLGESRTGKSTLLAQLSSLSPSAFVHHQQSGLEDTSFGEASAAERGDSVDDLGLGYGYFDVGDEDGEEIVARVGVYQVSSSNPSHLSLLPFALSTPADGLPTMSAQGADHHTSGSRMLSRTNAEGEATGSQLDTHPRPSIEALRDSLFLITLDWEVPWTFLSQLIEWLDVVRDVVESAAGTNKSSWSRERAVWDEMKEALETSIRTYADLSGTAGPLVDEDDGEVGNMSSASALVAVSNPAAVEGEEDSPLPEGCLTHNLGVPLVVVCTKADTIVQLERERNFKEEQFDYIQQVLRTICLKYGAGLFYTAQSKPASYEVLRSYVLHHLFSPTGRTFTFPFRASTVERDVLLVPAGWDSFGKIRALRDGFDCAGMANGWEWDAEVERIRRSKELPKGSREAEDVAEQQVDRRMLPGLVDGDRSGVESAIKVYEDIVEDWDASAPQLAMNAGRVKEPDEQAFLLQHYNTLQREPELRGKASRPGPSPQVPDSAPLSGKSVVGPMGSSSLSLPSVERAMQERQLSDDGRVGKPSSSRKEGQGAREREREGGRSTPVHRSVNSSALQSPSLSSSEKGGNSRPTSPLGGNQGGAQTPKQSEVLHSFFQSLLKEKGPGNATGPGRSSVSRGSATSERKSGS